VAGHHAAGGAAQASRSRAQDLADRAASSLTLVANRSRSDHAHSAWLALRSGEPAFAVQLVVTVLVIACPHALRLAIPLVVAISTTQAARAVCLFAIARIRGGPNLNAVVFDKTGTLTKGEFGFIDIATTDGLASDTRSVSQRQLRRTRSTRLLRESSEVRKNAVSTSTRGGF